MSDLLERATRALRETSETPEPRSGLTRGRVLDAAAKRYGHRHSPFVRWAIALAAVFAASTALARVAEYWPEIRRALTPDTSEPSAPRAPKSGRNRATKPRPAEQHEPSAAPAAAEPSAAPAERENTAAPAERAPPVSGPSPDAASDARVRPRRSPARAGERPPARAVDPPPSAAPPPATDSSSPAPESAELALFRRAQSLHLARDPGALAAWDAYLRVAADGVLAPEARYNRALCLVRLGRTREAREALEPFARGMLGGFRQREARALLQELGP